MFPPKSWRKIFASRDSSRGRYFPSGCSSPWVTVCFEIGIDSQTSYILSSSKDIRSICWKDRDEERFRLEFYFTRVSYLSVDDRRFNRVWCWFGMFFFCCIQKEWFDHIGFFLFQSNLLRELLFFLFWKILKILNFKF